MSGIPSAPRLNILALEDRITPVAGDLLRAQAHPQPVAGDGFGHAIAVNDRYIVVGAPYRDVTDFPDAGAVYVFNRATGEQVAYRPNPEPAAGDRYGWSVTVFDTSAWVGTPFDDPGGVIDAGSVYSIGFGPGGMVETRMNEPTLSAGDQFGYSVAGDGRANFMVIGAPGDDAGAADAGRVYRTGWTSGVVSNGPGYTAVNPQPHAGDRFGESVAVDWIGYTLIGAPGDDATGAADAGRAFWWDFDAGAGVPIENPNPAAGDRFGAAVAHGGLSDVGVIGAPGDTSGGVANAGAAYAFNLNGYAHTFGTVLNVLPNPNPTAGDRFGAAVSAFNLLAMVGAPGDSPGGIAGAGIAYEFRTTTGELLATMANPDPKTGDGLGSAVAIGYSRAVVGAPFGNPSNTNDAGIVYHFDANNRPRITNDTVVVRKNAVPTPVVTLATDSYLPDWGDFLSVSAVTQGTAGATVAISADGQSVTYKPATGFLGTDTFTYTVNDGNGATASATVTVLVSTPLATPGSLGSFGPANPDGEWSSNPNEIAATADWIVVRPNDQSAIRVYSAATGQQVRTLPNPGDGQSSPIAVSGNRLLVGHDWGNKAFLYDLTTGALLHTFQPTTGTISFGSSVALDGETVVVGTYEDYEGWSGNPHPNRSGRVYVFNATSGALVRTIVNPTFDYQEEGFGTAVAVEGNTLVVGAYRAHVAANLSVGQAYVYDLATGNLRYTLGSAARHFNSFFGADVAVSGDRIAVGGREQVHLFDRATGNLISQLGDPTYSSSDWFGMSMDLEGSRVVVGAMGDDAGGVENTGAAYLYDAASGTLLWTYDNPVPAAATLFGGSVALAAGRAIVGTWEGNPTAGAKAAYLFDTVLPPTAANDLFSINEDDPATVVNVLANDFAAPGLGALTVTGVTAASHGTVTLTGGVVRYAPAANYSGPDSFTYTVTDLAGGTATATVNVTVVSVNDPPTIQGAEFTIPELTPPGTVVGTVAGTDPDGDVLTHTITAGNTGGAFAIHPTTGRITVANGLALDFETTPVFALTVRAQDPGGLSATATVTVRLTDVAEAPSPAIDIEPGNSQNRVRLGSGSLVTVAILGSAEFNARQIRLASVRFGRTGFEDSLYRPAHLRWARFVDVNGDGQLDLVAKFVVTKTGFQPGDTKGFLTGRLKDGRAFTADDSVMIV
ncbi:MAG TPA: Ig-like domain-containing protein [Gemmataceae bacterium]|nr:Ig-like domain-containing protein [Gemmataceae bacterium]